MFNSSVGVVDADGVFLVFVVVVVEILLVVRAPPPEGVASSSVNNSPTISIGIASTKSLTSISGKRTVGSSAFVDITRVYLLIQTPSPSLFSLFFFFPKELFQSPLKRVEMSGNSSLLSLSLSLSFSRAFLWMDKKMTRVSCYTNAPRSPLPRRAACFTSHRAARERFLLRRKRGG